MIWFRNITVKIVWKVAKKQETFFHRHSRESNMILRRHFLFHCWCCSNGNYVLQYNVFTAFISFQYTHTHTIKGAGPQRSLIRLNQRYTKRASKIIFNVAAAEECERNKWEKWIALSFAAGRIWSLESHLKKRYSSEVLQGRELHHGYFWGTRDVVSCAVEDD